MTPAMTEFEARTSLNVLIATFQTADQAAAWIEANIATYPGCFVEKVRRFEKRETIFQHVVLARGVAA